MPYMMFMKIRKINTTKSKPRKIGMMKINEKTTVNNTEYPGELQVKVSKPENANLLYDYTIAIPSAGNLVLRPVMDGSVVLLPALGKGEQVQVIVTYSTKGMDIYKYNLSAYKNNVIQELTAEIKLNTPEYAIYREGLPHTEEITVQGATLHFDVKYRWLPLIYSV